MNYKKTGKNIILMAQIVIVLFTIVIPLNYSLGAFIYFLGMITGLVFLWIDKYSKQWKRATKSLLISIMKEYIIRKYNQHYFKWCWFFSFVLFITCYYELIPSLIEQIKSLDAFDENKLPQVPITLFLYLEVFTSNIWWKDL